jgi:hypothetical protein
MAVFEGPPPPPPPLGIFNVNIKSIVFLYMKNKHNTLTEEFQRPRSGQHTRGAQTTAG